MGEYADYMLNGDDCQHCGEHLGEGDGFPQLRRLRGGREREEDMDKGDDAKRERRREKNRKKRQRRMARRRAEREAAKGVETLQTAVTAMSQMLELFRSIGVGQPVELKPKIEEWLPRWDAAKADLARLAEGRP